VWSGIVGDQLIGPYISQQHLTRGISAEFLWNELPALLEDVLLRTGLEMYHQHDGAPRYFTKNVMQYLNEQLPNCRIGHRGHRISVL